MNAPQVIMIAWFALSLGILMVKHGEPRMDKYNFWSGLVSVVLQCALLYWGGFFG